MKIAVISDIHGNIFALNAVLEAIKKQDVTYTICLGDLVGYGCNPNEVIERLRNEKIPCIKGNYDASVVDKDYTFIRENEVNSFSLPWAIKNVTDENIKFLKELPNTITLEFNNKKIQFVHGSTRRINEYLTEDYEKIDEVINEISGRVTTLGAAQNRIESAVESIGVQTENITSSLSTLRDADVAEESSNYIKAQILQQASATLLATANQTPSIALNLL